MRMHPHRIILTVVASLLATAAAAQSLSDAVDVADRRVYLAKQISKLIIKQRDDDAEASPNTQSFEIIAKDKDGKEINIALDQAKQLYKWTAEDKSGGALKPKGTFKRIEEQAGKVKRARNILELTESSGNSIKRIRIGLSDTYASHSTAGASELAVKGGSWIARHPYLAAGSAVAVGGGAALTGGGGGSDDSSGSSEPASSGESGVPAGNVNVSGTWSGTGADGDAVTLQLTQSGTSVSGTITIDDTAAGGQVSNYPLSGSVSGSSFSFSFTDIDGNLETPTATVSGGTMSGSAFSATRV